MHRAGDEPFWTLPGGRAEIGETAEHTIKREMQEELSTDVEVLRLLWFVERFFKYDGLSNAAVVTKDDDKIAAN